MSKEPSGLASNEKLSSFTLTFFGGYIKDFASV